MIDVLQWIAIGLLCVSTLLLLSLLGRHDRLIRSMAVDLADTARLSMGLANTQIARTLRQPLVYCPTHGGQEADADGRCVQCR
jgi:hypothetical protein